MKTKWELDAFTHDQLLNLMDQVTSKAKSKNSIAGAAINQHNEQKAETIIATMSDN
jgi:hypothetical protein